MSCPDCFSGTVRSGEPTGTIQTLYGLDVYVAKPKARDGVEAGVKGTVVFIPDAFGWDFVNNRLLCDRYAERVGCLVYLPDFMGGHSAPISFMSLMEGKIRKPASWLVTLFVKPFYIAKALYMAIPWIFRNRQAVVKPRIFNFFTALRKDSPSGKLGVAGFCWGGYYSFLLARDDPSTRVRTVDDRGEGGEVGLVDVVFVAHPSMLKFPKDIEAVSEKVPMRVVVGSEDHAVKPEKVAVMKEVLEGKGKKHRGIEGEGEAGGEGVKEVIVLEGAKHGFAIRLNPKDEVQNEAAEKAEDLAVQWFGRWFA